MHFALKLFALHFSDLIFVLLDVGLRSQLIVLRLGYILPLVPASKLVAQVSYISLNRRQHFKFIRAFRCDGQNTIFSELLDAPFGKIKQLSNHLCFLQIFLVCCHLWRLLSALF